jgi:hypothetical protein
MILVESNFVRAHSYPPLEGEGRIASREARCDTGWGDSRSIERVPELRDHPTPSHISLSLNVSRPSPSRGG